jgi:hypothetical protein
MNINEMGKRYRKIGMKNYYEKYPMTFQEIKDKTREYLEIPIYLTLNQDELRDILTIMEKGELEEDDYKVLVTAIIVYEAIIWNI